MEERYIRQVMLGQVGDHGQEKLARASVVVVGAGGLGSPALTYLAMAGVGRIGLIDPDTVSPSNLNRQFLYGQGDVGRRKALCARDSLAALNGGVDIVAHEARLTDGNARALLAGYDLVLGAVDSYEARFVINRAAVALKIPYIDGGASGLNGFILFSHPPQTPCLNCVLPNGKKRREPGGVLGTTAGTIGTMQANLALLWLLGHGSPIENKLLVYDGFRMTMDLTHIKRDEHCPVCGGGGV